MHMGKVRIITERIFIPLSFLLRPAWLQRFLRRLGLRLPYFLAKHLKYTGEVDIQLGTQTIYLQSQNTPIEITAFWKGIFAGREGAELRVWHALAQHATQVYDIGANTGIYSIVAGTNQVAEVAAFEPVPVVHAMLVANVARNGMAHITPQSSVVSDTVGDVTLYVPKSGWVDVASIDQQFAEGHRRDEAMATVTCPSVTLDSVATERDQTGLTLIKIDVEGAEAAVLRGMSEVLSAPTTVILIELLTEATFAECQALLPATYTCFGVIQASPYLVASPQYNAAIKNYVVVADTTAAQITSMVAEAH